MSIVITSTGHSLELGEQFKAEVVQSLSCLNNMCHHYDARVVCHKTEVGLFHVDAFIHVDKGRAFKASGIGNTAYHAARSAVKTVKQRIVENIRKTQRRRKR